MSAALVAIAALIKKIAVWVGVSVIGKGIIWLFRRGALLLPALWQGVRSFLQLRGAGVLVFAAVQIFMFRVMYLIVQGIMSDFSAVSDYFEDFSVGTPPPFGVFIQSVEFFNAFFPVTEAVTFSFVLIGMLLYVGIFAFIRKIFLTAFGRGA